MKKRKQKRKSARLNAESPPPDNTSLHTVGDFCDAMKLIAPLGLEQPGDPPSLPQRERARTGTYPEEPSARGERGHYARAFGAFSSAARLNSRFNASA